MFGIGTLGAGLFTGSIAVSLAQAPFGFFQGKVSPPPPGLMAPAKVSPNPLSGGAQAMQTAPVWRDAAPAAPPSTSAPAIVTASGPIPTASPPIKLVADQVPVPTSAGVPIVAPPATLPMPVISPPIATLPAVSPPMASPAIAPPPATLPSPVVPTPSLPPPTVVIETQPNPNPNPEPKPLMLGGGVPSQVVAPPTVTSGPVPSGMLQAKHTAGVSVETVAPESVSVGQDCTYELVVRNDGHSAVWNVRVEDTIPVGAKYLSSEPAGELGSGRLSWNMGTIDAGQSKKIRVVVRPSDEGELRNRTVVTFAAATEAKMKVTRPKVAVTLTAPESAKAGEEVAFTIRLVNSGTGPATNLIMQARLSDGLHHANGSLLELKLPSLAAGQSRTIPLKAIATKAGSQACSISAVAEGSTAEPAKSMVTILEPKLTARVIGPGKCLVRAEPVYTLEFTNPGTAATDPLTISAAIPPGFDYLQSSDGGLLSPSGKEVLWKLTGLPAGQGKAVSLKLKSTAPSEAVVKVQVGTATNEGVPTSGVTPVAAVSRGLEAKAELAIRSEGVAALRFEVIDVEDPVEVGKEAIYEIKVINQGTGLCTNVQIIGFPAEGTQAVSATGPTTVRLQAGQMVFDPIARLDVKGESIYRVKVKGTVAGDQKFRVQVSCDQIRTPIIKEENTRFTKE